MKQNGNSILLNNIEFKDEKAIEKAVLSYQPFNNLTFHDVKFNLNPKGYFQRRADLILTSKHLTFWGIVEVETKGASSKYQNHISHQLKEQNSLIDYNWNEYHEQIFKKIPSFRKNPNLITLIQFNKPFHFLLSDSEYNNIYNKLFDINSLVLQKFSDSDKNTGFSIDVNYSYNLRKNISVIYSDGNELYLPNPNLIGIKLNNQIVINYKQIKRTGFFLGDTSTKDSRLYESGVIFFDTGMKNKIKKGKYILEKIGINNYRLTSFTQ